MAPYDGGPAFYDSIWSTSSYNPSPASIYELKKELRLQQASWVTPGPQVIDSHDREEVKTDSWILQLSLNDLQEIEDAVTHFQSKSYPRSQVHRNTGLDLNRLQAEHFPLPTLGAKIKERSKLFHNEQPYFLVRGLKPQWFSKYKNVVVFLGIASHVSTKRAMANDDATVLHHVTNIEAPDGNEEKTYRGPANRNIDIPFHTDYGDIVSLYTLSRPASGGDFHLADINDIVSKIEQSRPDLLQTLQEDFTMAHPGRPSGFETRPLLFSTPSGGKVIQASRSRLCNGFRPRPAEIAELSPLQIQAIDALHAAGQQVSRRIRFLSGDMLFFNNLRMMHARDGYVDGCEAENTTRRYLLRLIMRGDGWEEVPEPLRETWRELFEHNDAEEKVPVKEGLFSFKASH
ncbi:hypothetical protein B0H66DRAFT_587859 [Apodospora peruviana]|uniref:TauD/TfdA-like domain-containing protein n=1 Tax=Apodospora peruviana TaxID=516989 RepID=A0AAE0MAI4_9PEZI|nr:hypothetical protein B0H66DRAFT_587859 [Apodospora peruviana]